MTQLHNSRIYGHTEHVKKKEQEDIEHNSGTAETTLHIDKQN